jgi:hypothetical protein
MAKPGTKRLLKEITSGDLEWVYVHITEKAVEWAVAGFVEEANDLLTRLWKFNIPHSGNLWLPDEGLQVLWQLSGKKPPNIPFAFKDENAIEAENWSRVFYPCGDEVTRKHASNATFPEMADEDLFFKALNAGYDGSEKPEDILAALKRFAGTEHSVGYSYFHATTCGVLLAARNNLSQDAAYFLQLWGAGYSKYWSNYMLSYLMSDKAAAAYLLKGLLAPVFKVTREICKNETVEIIQALTKRMSEGKNLVYKTYSWKQLLDEISVLALQQKTIGFADAVLKKKSLGRSPVNEKEINETEKRLNIILPADYREFLFASNGFEQFSYTGVTLSSIVDVDFLVNVDQQLVDIWTDSMQDMNTAFAAKLKSSLIIGGRNEEQQLLLIPLPGNRWECWHFSSWRPGEAVYESFRFYMEQQLQDLQDELHSD